MPEATFMRRDRRRDHGFTSPDPTLTRELGVPNACDGCHGDRPARWSEQQTNVWFGAAMERPARHRARVIARARRQDASVVPELARWATSEANDAWRAALVALLEAWVDSPAARPALVRALGDASPLVQAAAVRALARDEGVRRELVALRRASSRLVRIEAAWATREDLARDPAARAEVQRWLDLTCDQPAGALRRSDLALIEGDPTEARAWARRAAEWDPSGPTLHALGRVLHATGDIDAAIEAFASAARADPRDATHPYARALVLAESGRTADAVADLERAVEIDPRFARAQYNLGLARAALGRLEPALEALQRAEVLDPASPDAAWAAGTLHLHMGRRDLAREAARRALARDPTHAGALALMREVTEVSDGSASGPRPR
jgi:tetratricopeptide (TPR) repeat protein